MEVIRIVKLPMQIEINGGIYVFKMSREPYMKYGGKIDYKEKS